MNFFKRQLFNYSIIIIYYFSFVRTNSNCNDYIFTIFIYTKCNAKGRCSFNLVCKKKKYICFILKETLKQDSYIKESKHKFNNRKKKNINISDKTDRDFIFLPAKKELFNFVLCDISIFYNPYAAQFLKYSEVKKAK